MALDLGDLVTRLEVQGARQAEREIRDARRNLEQLGTTATRTERQLDQVGQGGGLRDTTQDAERARRNVGQLGDESQRTRSQLGRIQVPPDIDNDARRAARGVGSIGDQADQAGGRLGRLNESIGRLSEGISDRLGDSGNSGGGAFVASFGSKIMQLGTKAGPVGVALAAVVGLGAIAGAKLADAVQDGMNIQQDRAMIQAKFGLSDAQMAQVGKAAALAFGNAWGESVEANMSAAGAAMQSGLIKAGASAAEMDPLLEKLNMVTDVMGEEIPAVTRSAGQLMKTGLAKNGTEALDLIYKGQVNNLNVSEDWLDTIDEYSTQFRSLGLTGEEAFGLLSQGVKAGARDTDVVADSLKEMSLRVADGTAQATTGFDLLGVSAEEMQTKMAAGGTEAHDALEQILSGLQKIQDPTDRYNAALALFGTKAEDMKGAINGMDLSKAADQFRNTGLSAEQAAQKLDTPAAKVQAAKNKITLAANDIKLKLAEAFAPQVGKFADWVSSHQEEIVKFFTLLGQAGLYAGSAIAGLGWAWAKSQSAMLQGINVLLYALDPLFLSIEGIGKMIGLLPGSAGEFGDKIASKAESIRKGMHDMMTTTADGLSTAGDAMYSLSTGMANAAGDLGRLANQAGTTTSGMVNLATKIREVPDEKTVIISDNSPQVIDQLEKLGLKVTQLPDGSLRVEAETKEAETALNNLTKARSVEVIAQLNASQLNSGYGINGLFPKRFDGGIVTAYAEGGVRARWIPKPSEAGLYSSPSGGATMFAENFGGSQTRTGGEAYIPLGSGKRVRSTAILGQVADIFGLGLVKMNADGDIITPEEYSRLDTGPDGVNTSIWRAVKSQFPNATLNSAKTDHSVDGGYHPKGMAIDVGGPMQEVADFMFQNYRDQLGQIIWNPMPSWYNIGGTVAEGAQARSIYGEDTMAQHGDHVHIAALAPLHPAGGDQAGQANVPELEGVGKLTANSSREDIASAIVGEGRKRGYTDEEIKAVLATAIQESNLDPNASGGGGAWHGIFQQDSSYPGRDDPNTNISGFYDRLDEKKKSGGWDKEDPYNNIFWLQQRPGENSAQSAVANGRGAYKTEIQSRSDEAGQLLDEINRKSPRNAATAGGPSDGSGIGTSVYVTGGHLDSVGSTTTPDTTTTPATTDTPSTTDSGASKSQVLRIYGPQIRRNAMRTGGTVPGVGSGDIIPSMLEPGEEVTPKGPARKYRTLLQAIRKDQLQYYADGGTVGGFGGYTTAGAEYHKGYNWYDLAALGVGAGFAVASGFNDQGQFQGFDLGSTAVPGTSNLMDMLKQLAEKPTVKVEYVEVKTNDPREFGAKLMDLDPNATETMKRKI